jgi:hypothetical protein
MGLPVICLDATSSHPNHPRSDMKLVEGSQVGSKKGETRARVVSQPRLTTRRSDHVVEARDGSGRLLAHYNPRTNETRDCRGDLLGLGNRLYRILLSVGPILHSEPADH